MISFFGDLHPSYFGNVVKAMGSAKQGYPAVTNALKNIASNSLTIGESAFLETANQQLRSTVYLVKRLTPNILEIIIHAPLAARKFEPGQFYRLQNFESLARHIEFDGIRTRMSMEGLALTGAWVDREQGLISTIVLEMGGSSSLCANLKPGDPVILMGPTGAPTEIPQGETVVLVGGGLGNAVLFSIGAALRKAGCKVLYFAGYKKLVDRYKVTEIENAADAIVWCCDEAPGFIPQRTQDKTYVGNMVQAMHAYAKGDLGEQTIAISEADRIVAIGSDRMMAAVAVARHTVLKPFLKKGHAAIGSINSPMQCMMKEICAQCLQCHKDPLSGKMRYVFSCFNQDQPLDEVDWNNLNQRLRQNGVQEKLTTQWIAICQRKQGTQPIPQAEIAYE
jgi:NAD(P)H-flavin reductase